MYLCSAIQLEFIQLEHTTDKPNYQMLSHLYSCYSTNRKIPKWHHTTQKSRPNIKNQAWPNL